MCVYVSERECLETVTFVCVCVCECVIERDQDRGGAGGVSGVSWAEIPHVIVTALSSSLSAAKLHLEWILCEQTPRNMITLG